MLIGTRGHGGEKGHDPVSPTCYQEFSLLYHFEYCKKKQKITFQFFIRTNIERKIIVLVFVTVREQRVVKTILDKTHDFRTYMFFFFRLQIRKCVRLECQFDAILCNFSLRTARDTVNLYLKQQYANIADVRFSNTPQ